MDFGQIINTLMNENSDNNIRNIIKILKSRLQHEHDDIRKQELYTLLLIAYLRTATYENKEILETLDNVVENTKLVEKTIIRNYNLSKDFSSKIMFDIFYKVNLHRLFMIDNLFRDSNMVAQADSITVLRKSLEKKHSLITKNYGKYFALSFHRLFSNYGTSYMYLLANVLIQVTFYAIIFVINDKYLYPAIPVSQQGIQHFDYYMYISIATFSNLGADMEMAGTLFMRIIMGVEQTIGVIVFGIFIVLVSKRL